MDDGNSVLGEVSKYDVCRAYVDLALIREPPFPLRCIEPQHVEELVNKFKVSGFLEGVGAMCVAMSTIEEKVAQGQTITRDVVLIDGRHRWAALIAMQKSGEEMPPTISNLLRKIPVAVYGRKDGEEMSEMEMIGIAAQLNDASHSVKAMTFQDKVHGAISVCRAMQGNGMDLAKTPVVK